MIVVKVAIDPTTTVDIVSNHLAASITGQQTALSDEQLRKDNDIARIRKVYKLNPSTFKKLSNGISSSHDQEIHDLEVQILGLMALRGAA